MLAFSTTNEHDLLAIWSQTTVCIDRALPIEQYSTWHGARVVCLGQGAQKLGRGDAYAAETGRIRNATAIW